MSCSKNMCGKAEATAGDDPESEAVGTQRGESTDHGNTGTQEHRTTGLQDYRTTGHVGSRIEN